MLDDYLKRKVLVGDLTVVSRRSTVRFGDGTGTPIVVRLKPGAALKLALNPELKLGECYMDGELEFERGDLYALLELIARNPGFYDKPRTVMARLGAAALRQISQMNDRAAARRNVAHHYDLSNALYSRFLDADMQYSCAYFTEPEQSLDAAQMAKKIHIAAKLKLPRSGRLLDIGCGWGGLGLTLAHLAPGLDVTGVTLSHEQLGVARRRAQAQGLASRVDFQLIDYRDIQGPFDRIVSVGMFEHVGRPNYQTFFHNAARLLSDDGVMLLHSIGRRTPPGVTQPFIAKYIFPGGYIPSLSEVLPAIENAGLWVTDVEVLRLHYAETLKEWRHRFIAVKDDVRALYDERFCRMWEIYLASSEAAFRWFGMMVFQIQIAKRIDTLPLTRDYMSAYEREHRRMDQLQANEAFA